jgi:hypothetical protein
MGSSNPAALRSCVRASQAPAWCNVRQAGARFSGHDVYGIAALIAAALALFWKHPWLAWLAAALGAFALVLYCFELARWRC